MEEAEATSDSLETLRALAALKLRQGRAAEAKDIVHRALDRAREDASLHALLGEAWLRLGQGGRAKRCLRKALTLDPRQGEAWLKLGEALAAERSGFGEAAEALRQAIELLPNDPKPAMMLAEIMCRQGRHEDAIAAYRAAAAANPAIGDMLGNLGVALEALGRRNQSVSALETAALLLPEASAIQDNLGNALLGVGRAEEAEARHRRALALGSRSPNTWSNLGNALHRQGRLAESVACYRRAIGLAPGVAKYHTNLALTLLLAGEAEEGWREYEWRWRDHPNFPAYLRDKAWRGEPLPEGTLLLQAEQGYGDTIQFIRYAPLLKRQVARVILVAQPELVRLMGTVPGLDAVVPENAALPQFDRAVTLMSLPGLGVKGLEAVPGGVPYLSVPPGAGVALPEGKGFKVGIAWAGRPTHGDDWNRSIPARLLAPLLEVPGTVFYSFQRGAVAERLGRPPADKVFEAADRCADFADTAAIVAGLDLVVSVDTAIIHLAGAMGRPVWAMLPSVPDFRWGMTGEESPWYPSLRLFRRAPGEGWEPVIARVAEALRRAVAKS